MTQNIIKFGLSINNYTYDEIGQRLYFDGTAIESGTWIGQGGVPYFFPKEVLIKAAPLFNNIPLVCEHRGLEIGWINKVEPTELGFRITDAVVTHRESVEAILTGKKLGLSIEGLMTCDDVRLIVEEIIRADNISLVTNPACKVCGIEHIYIDDSKPKGNLAMSETEEVIEDDALIDLDSVITSSKDTGEVVDSTTVETVDEAIETLEEVVEASENIEEVIEEVKVEISPVTEATPPAEASVALSGEDTGTPTTASALPEIYDTEFSELKVALASATSTVEAISIQLSDASVKINELEVALSSSNSKLNATESQLSVALSENAEYKKTISELTAKIKNIEETERNKIISEIKEIDPEIDVNFINSMTTVQLSSYKSNINRFIKADRKSVKIDEQIQLSSFESPESTSFDRHDVASGIIPFLSKQQKAAYSKFKS